MARNSNRRRGLLASPFGICALAFAFASPAIAEPTTLWCEGEKKDGGTGNTISGPWNGSIDIDYAAGTISMTGIGIPNVPAVITDREISFTSSNWGNFDSYRGVINRLSGTVLVQRIDRSWKTVTIEARCRVGTQKF